MENTVKERIMIFLDFKDMKPATFERLCGLSNGYLNQLKKEPSLSKIEKILETFPELNKEWLMTGEGQMLNGTVIGDGNIKGDNNNWTNVNTDSALLRAIEAIGEQQKITAKSQEQIDRLIGIIEKNFQN
ncbi:MAG: hypothetical protein IKO23_09870 [Bacteroidales bacterium]|nr:hypothetical protein [Bacteroidales bacterium]